MNSMNFLVSTLFDLYIMVVLLRVWLQWARADFYNPFSQFVVKATQPVVAQLRRMIPSIATFDLATVVFAFVLCVVKFFVLQLVVSGGLPLLNVSYLLIGFIALSKAAGSLLFWVLILRAILSWVSQGHNPIEFIMIQLTEPLVAPIRRVLPSFGGLDLSVLVLFVVLQFLNFLIGDLLSPYFGNLWFVL
ncbi:YggT family protein [Candidatus Enterovibrio altilux]|uniref:Integral membrane protein YggT, involved in response to extracytoplasmic stress (Osmotic shock) n=1 Tax=Candidatus Enterovibrio altilux TaxID=1927128 RepID=A0A291B8R3_9GAMM|nr:YggT family protein [Candidatus Enterovibrio luxaltus]ATF09395.1 Integral membrane protein YggT, involved in response to extracytoplasmic stress (osmotic shock) [Candidatus Enterovibrio luxaltus]